MTTEIEQAIANMPAAHREPMRKLLTLAAASDRRLAGQVASPTVARELRATALHTEAAIKLL
jgi:hypothetical protein